MWPQPSTVATAANPALIPFTSRVMSGRYGAESPLDPAGGSAGQTAQNRRTPPTISVPEMLNMIASSGASRRVTTGALTIGEMETFRVERGVPRQGIRIALHEHV
jgi:hypothetical protein